MRSQNRVVVAANDVWFEYPTSFRANRNQLVSGSELGLHRRKHILQQISFEIYEGEIFGVIGRNGSGKSTLAKLISRIVFPSKGRLVTPPKIAPLIELGAGMDPELTVLENIYLYGVLIGNRLKDIKSRADSILEWSGLEEFRDSELRRLSSGMRARLAFAVATELKPDLLIVDEVLSVGDSEFQRKSRQRFQEVVSSGTSVLFISHDLPAVKDLCERTMLLREGQVVTLQKSDAAVNVYIQTPDSQS